MSGKTQISMTGKIIESRRFSKPMLAPVVVVVLCVLITYIMIRARTSPHRNSAASPHPESAIEGVLNLFESKQILGLADLHGCSQELEFLDHLVTSPKFLSKVNVLTWELGNSRFQQVMDDYILKGKDVTATQLNKCWRENSQANLLGDTPRLLEVLSRIRQSNLSSSQSRKLRVLLIDAPVDWADIKDKRDVNRANFDRDAHMAQIIDTEVYSKAQRALFFAGAAHLLRGKRNGSVDSSSLPKTALGALESLHPGTTAAIWLHVSQMADNQSFLEIRNWPKPSLAEIHGTWYEMLKQPGLMKRRPPSFIAAARQPAGPVPTGGLPAPPPNDSMDLRNWDAVLYLGLREELRRTSSVANTEVEASWVSELQRRRDLLGLPDVDLFQPSSEEPYFRSEMRHPPR